MKRFTEFCLRSQRIFYAVNVGFALMIPMIICYFFNADLSELFLQWAISVPSSFLAVWVIGGYAKIKQSYFEKSNRSQNLS